MRDAEEYTRKSWKARHFTFDEFVDELSGLLILAPGFIVEADHLREAYGHPMQVTDGCRSAEEVEWLIRRGYPASPNSLHLMKNEKYQTSCCAMDVARPVGPRLHKLISCALVRHWSVGLGKTFVHLDRRAQYTDLLPNVYSYHAK